jgi:2-dehydro-3-deoxygluconokinase
MIKNKETFMFVSESKNIACIGECMIEISHQSNKFDFVKLGFGGDTLNTAIYLSRLLSATKNDVGFVTLLGSDPYAKNMLDTWQAEGINCDFVEHLEGRETGLYSIHLDAVGERVFYYWRSQAPARELFEGDIGAKRIERLYEKDVLYFSGITLAVLYREGRKRLLKLAQYFKSEGKAVIFDTNYRPRLWQGEDAEYFNRAAMESSTMLLPSLEDITGIFGNDQVDWREFLESLQIPEIVFKQGGKPLLIFHDGGWIEQHLDKIQKPIDTTAAGDSFNAGYIAARLQGKTPVHASLLAHNLACEVISYPGAIIPKQ